jgi:SAM-dependent methyltransferase
VRKFTRSPPANLQATALRPSEPRLGDKSQVLPDAIFAHPRLASVYDAFDGPRDDLSAYVAIAGELEADRVLDVGCGTGCLAILLAETGRTVVGVDPAPASLEIAKAKDGAAAVTWIQGDAGWIPLVGADLAVMTGNVAQVFLADRLMIGVSFSGQVGGTGRRAAARRLTTAGDGEVLDRAVEDMTARAADLRASQQAAARFDGVPVLHGGRKPAPDRAAAIHVRRAVQEHHVGLHRILHRSCVGYGLASNTALISVSLARRKPVRPAWVTTSRILASPAWPPSASPMSCDNDAGVHSRVERP